MNKVNLAVNVKTKVRNKKRKSLTLTQQKALFGYLFIAPFFIGFLLLFLTPLIQSLQFSFSKLSVTSSGYHLTNIGLENYEKVLRVDPNFVPSLLANATEIISRVPVIIIFSFFAASLLNQKFKGRAFARAIFFLPVILTSGIVLAIENTDLLVNAAQGAAKEEIEKSTTALQFLQFRQLLFAINIPAPIVSFLILAVDQIYEIVIASGVQILIFLAGLQSVPKSLYEASTMDGATGWENFWKITFPMVSPLIIVNLVYTIINTFTSADNQIMSLIRTTIFSQSEFGRGSAMAWVYLGTVALILTVLSLIVLKLTSRYKT
ncbi:binding-protein-dependent transport system inner membrane protein [Neobacillus bataviensis LMG 21833]|uniref:Binding-protein-dependent transport system inner membrane protein n=1 Tax=Neobacillus bataviensis LMG 21833 TaxID=1117379 RepID=K6DA67_9BACI|nr:sugar ABC transporter permease [Neobacillus bataviensis]EKN65209.1 binding-protein-dependent transport system inner membrane protein [Neobacillus bataviensis LMG 21833]